MMSSFVVMLLMFDWILRMSVGFVIDLWNVRECVIRLMEELRMVVCNEMTCDCKNDLDIANECGICN